MKHLRTTLAGAFAGFLAILHNQGVSVGHIGSADFVSLLQAIAMALTGFYAADKTVTDKQASEK
jgi:hypothetical protein